jgi:hypothetical protein
MGQTVKKMKVGTKYKVKGICKKLTGKVVSGVSGQGHGKEEGWYTLTFDDGTIVKPDWCTVFDECFSGGGKSRRNRKSKKSRKSKSRKSNRRR